MKKTDWLILGSIAAVVFVARNSSSMSGIGATPSKNLDWFLKNRHKLDKKYSRYELGFYYENKRTGEQRFIEKEFSSIVDFVSYWEHTAWAMQINGWKVTLCNLLCYEGDGPVHSEVYHVKKTP